VLWGQFVCAWSVWEVLGLVATLFSPKDVDEMVSIDPSCNTDQGVQQQCKSLSDKLIGEMKVKNGILGMSQMHHRPIGIEGNFMNDLRWSTTVATLKVAVLTFRYRFSDEPQFLWTGRVARNVARVEP